MTAARRAQAGFTLIEVMISVLLAVIGVMGIVALTTVSVRDSSAARHATEASVLAEDKMEVLRSTTLAGTGTGTDAQPVDPQGSTTASSSAIYTRSWTWTASTATVTYSVSVSWKDEGTAAVTTCTTSGARCVTMRSIRGL